MWMKKIRCYDDAKRERSEMSVYFKISDNCFMFHKNIIRATSEFFSLTTSTL